MRNGTTLPWIRPLRLGALLAFCIGGSLAKELAPLPPIGTPTRQGVASWYGRAHEGRRTASGGVFRRKELTAAHRTAPFGTRYLVLYQGQSVDVTITDRGPYLLRRGRYPRDLDLSEAAARSLGMMASGVVRVSYRELPAEPVDPVQLLPLAPACQATLD